MASIDKELRIGGVELAVSDLARSSDFYERVLGLPLVSRDEQRARLGTDPLQPALTLTQLPAATALSPSATGLYHVAWLHPSRAALAATVRRVAQSGWRFDGASDHGVSEALYLSDPDGLGIEIYADRPRESWSPGPGGRGVGMVTLALDLDDLLAQAPPEPAPVAAPGTHVGHVHLKVSDVPRSAGFYVGALGFDEMAALPSAAFVAAGGYHHHIGMNSWQSAGAPPPPPSAPGLRLVEFTLADPTALDALERAAADARALARPREQDGTVSVRDPDGELLAFALARADA